MQAYIRSYFDVMQLCRNMPFFARGWLWNTSLWAFTEKTIDNWSEEDLIAWDDPRILVHYAKQKGSPVSCYLLWNHDINFLTCLFFKSNSYCIYAASTAQCSRISWILSTPAHKLITRFVKTTLWRIMSEYSTFKYFSGCLIVFAETIRRVQYHSLPWLSWGSW